MVLYKHFQSNGHWTSEEDFQYFGIEVVCGDIFILRQREQYWIQQLQTIYKGLNSNRST